MNRYLFSTAAVLLLLFLAERPQAAHAQAVVAICVQGTNANGGNSCPTAAIGAPVPVGAGCVNTIPISQTGSTDIHTFTNTGYVCSIFLITADVQSVSLIEGTGSVCGTSGTAILGSTTVGNGMALIASEGFVNNTLYKLAKTGEHLCLLQSGSSRLAGAITYADK